MKRSLYPSGDWISKFFDLSNIFWAFVSALLLEFGHRFIRVPLPSLFVRPTVHPSAVLTSTDNHTSKEHLTFKIRIRGWKSKNGFPLFRIYVPPEFVLSAWLEGEEASIVCSMPGHVRTFGADECDPVAPGGWGFDFIPSILETQDCWFIFSLGEVIMPKIAGVYAIRAFVYPSGLGHGQQAVSLRTPVLLVKGEVDPGIATGTIMYGAINPIRRGGPIKSSGMVDMVGTAIDSYVPDRPSTGRPVEALGQIRARRLGHYEVWGVAPGVYTMYAEAADCRRQKIAENVLILPGQSFQLDAYLIPDSLEDQIFSNE